MSPRPCILIVEDDVQLRQFYRSVLIVEGFDIAEVGDGLDALREIDQSPPDLVVLDLALPRLDGEIVLQEIMARTATRRIPVVVVTGDPRGLAESPGLCILRKPVDPDALLSTIRKCLGSRPPHR